MGYLETNTKSSPAGERGADARKRPRRRLAGTEASALGFAAGAEAAVADLEARRPAGMGPLERALAARVRSVIAELRACAKQVAEDGLMVAGSMGQQRVHPLVKVSADLRREIADGLKELTFRVEQAEMIAVMNGSGSGTARQ